MRTAFLDLLSRAARLPANDLWSPLLAEWLAEIPEFIAIRIRLLKTKPDPGMAPVMLKPISDEAFGEMIDWAHAFEVGIHATDGAESHVNGLSPGGHRVLSIIAPFMFRQALAGDLTLITQPLSGAEHREWMHFAERLTELLFSRHINGPRSHVSEIDDPRKALEFQHEMQRLFSSEKVTDWMLASPWQEPLESWYTENESYLGSFLRRLQTVFDLDTAFIVQRVSEEHSHVLVSTDLPASSRCSGSGAPRYDELPAEVVDMLEFLGEQENFRQLFKAKLSVLPANSRSGLSWSPKPVIQTFPCQVAGMTYGYLGVSTNRVPSPGPFARLMAIVTNHLGFWFSHLYQLRKEAGRAQLLKQINMTFNVITGNVHLDGIFDQLCDNLEMLFGQKHGAVVIFSTQTSELEIKRRFGIPPAGFDLEKAVSEAGIIRNYIADGSAFRVRPDDADQTIRFVFPLSPTPQVAAAGDDVFHQRSLGGVVIYNTNDNRMMNADILELLNFLLNGFSAALRVAFNYQEKLETIKALEGLIARLDNQDKLLEEMVDIIKRLLKVERISFLTVDNDSQLLCIKNSYGIKTEVVRSMQIPIGEGISGYVAATGETLRIDNIEESESKFKKRSLEHYFNRSLLSVPLISTASDGSSRVLGVINVNNKTNGLTFNQQDQQMLESIAHLVVAALTNIDLTNAKHEHDLLQQQLDNARDVQMALLPRKFLNMPPELDMFAKSEPAIQIGGDFFDGIKLPDGRWLAAIGDVSGKGMSAAIIMAMSRIILRTVVHETSEPAKIMGRMHEYLSRDISDYYFVTMQIVVIDPATGAAEMVSAGHGPLLACLGGSLVQLESKGGFPLAVGGGSATFEAVPFRVQTGDQLLFFTDGLPEEYAPNREMFGMDRTKELFTASRGLPPKELVERFFEAAEKWRAGGDAHDDLTIMAVEYRGVTQ